MPVICATCGTENNAGRKFCLECGTSLAVGCPACGTPNPPGARSCGECGARALRATGSHATIALLVARIGEAGFAALDGRADAARPGLVAAYAGLRDIGAARKQALAGLVMATLLGVGDGPVRTAIAESRQLFEKMRAGLWLALLDAPEAGGATAPTASPVASPQAGRPTARPPVPADRG